MNVKNILASVSLLIAAGAAMAQPAELNFPGAAVQQKSSLTREQVKAEVLAARAAGELDFNDVTYPLQQAQPSVRTRADVKAEVLVARAAGLLDQNDTNYPINYELPRRPSVTASLQATGQ